MTQWIERTLGVKWSIGAGSVLVGILTLLAPLAAATPVVNTHAIWNSQFGGGSLLVCCIHHGTSTPNNLTQYSALNESGVLCGVQYPTMYYAKCTYGDWGQAIVWENASASGAPNAFAWAYTSAKFWANFTSTVDYTCPPNNLCPIGNITLYVNPKMASHDLVANAVCGPGGFAMAESVIYGDFKVEYSSNGTVVSDGSAGFVGTMGDFLSGSGHLNSSTWGMVSCGAPGGGATGVANIWSNALSPSSTEAWLSSAQGYAYSGTSLDLVVTWTIFVQALVFDPAGGTSAYAGAAFPSAGAVPTNLHTADDYTVQDCTSASIPCATFTVTTPPPPPP